MAISMYELTGLFFIYSFFGWVMETTYAAIRRRRFENRGLVNLPFCVTYGIAAAAVTVFCGEMHGFWLFAAGVILSTLIEWTAGHLTELVYHERWWDYSKVKWNLDGYISLPASVLWGVLCVIVGELGNPLFIRLFVMIPALAGHIIVWIVAVALAIDILATLVVIHGRSKRLQQWKEIDSLMTEMSAGLYRWICEKVDRRIRKAYPQSKAAPSTEERKAHADTFAYGCSPYKILWLFVAGAFLGDITETLFCRVTAGVWMSRSSVVWGPFSIVWGLAVAAATLLLYKYRDRSDHFIFAAGTFLGGLYEYICSVFTELVFGKVFWDYSKMPFNLGGRINLLYCFFWGIAAVVWIKGVYPCISAWIEKIPVRPGKVISWVMLVFFCLNITVSGMALVRSDQRSRGEEAESQWQEMMDDMYPDEKLGEIYPNAKAAGGDSYAGINHPTHP